MAHQMNLWGVEGCRLHRDQIVTHLQDAASKMNLATEIAAKLTGGWFVDTAIKRAAKKSLPAG